MSIVSRKRQTRLFSTSSQTKPILLSRGSGLFGALGRGDLLDSIEFCEVNMHGLVPQKAAAGWGHSVVLTSCGKMLVFGRPFDFSVLLRLNVFREVGGVGVARYASAMSRWFSNDETSGLYASPILVSNMMAKAEVGNVTDVVASGKKTIRVLSFFRSLIINTFVVIS